MTPEIPINSMLPEISRAVQWLRKKHNIHFNSTASLELEQELGLHWCIDQDGMVYAVQFDTEAQHTWFMLRWA